MDWGPEEKSLILLAETSPIVPPALLKKPTLTPVQTWYWDEFNVIASDRDLDQGYPTAIKTEQIETYCRFFKIDNQEEFHAWIKLIDRIYLAIYYEKKKAENGKPASNPIIVTS